MSNRHIVLNLGSREFGQDTCLFAWSWARSTQEDIFSMSAATLCSHCCIEADASICAVLIVFTTAGGLSKMKYTTFRNLHLSLDGYNGPGKQLQTQCGDFLNECQATLLQPPPVVLRPQFESCWCHLAPCPESSQSPGLLLKFHDSCSESSHTFQWSGWDLHLKHGCQISIQVPEHKPAAAQ